MINVSVGQIINLVPVLEKLITRSYTGRIAFSMARLMREITKENEIFAQTRAEIVRKYADKDDSGEILITPEGTIHISEENLVSCNKEINEVLKEKIVLSIEAISMEWLEDIELTIEEALALEPFVI